MLLQLKIPKYLKLTKVEDIWRKTLETTTTVGPCLSSHIAWGLVTLVAYLFFRRIKGCCVCVCACVWGCVGVWVCVCVFVCVCLRETCVCVCVFERKLCVCMWCGCVIMWMTVCVRAKSVCVRVYHCVCVWQCVFETVCVRESVCECESSIVCVYWDGIFRGEWVGCVNCFLFFFVSQFLSSWVRRCGSSANFVTTFLSGTSISQLLHLSNWLFCHKKLKTFLVIYSNQKLQKKLFQNAK